MIGSAQNVRTAQEWEEAIGAKVRAAMAAPEMARYFAVKMTQARARVALLQLSLFVSCRRDGWIKAEDFRGATVYAGFATSVTSGKRWPISRPMRSRMKNTAIFFYRCYPNSFQIKKAPSKRPTTRLNSLSSTI